MVEVRQATVDRCIWSNLVAESSTQLLGLIKVIELKKMYMEQPCGRIINETPRPDKGYRTEEDVHGATL